MIHILVSFSLVLTAFAVGEAWGFPIQALRPTQFAVGGRAVESKKNEIILKLSKGKLDKYLRANPVPVVLGPGDRTYMVDHHHLCSALIKASQKEVEIETKEDWSNLSENTFWAKMQAANYVYLFDEKGKLRRLEDLPSRLDDLKEDPYRSLAYFVRKQGGFKKSSAPFAEFQWAQFFRSRVNLGKGTKGFESAVQEALKLAHSKAAKDLPGYFP